MGKKNLTGLTALLVVTAFLAGCQNAKQSQVVNITGPTSVTGGDNGGGGNNPPPTTPPPAGTPVPGSFALDVSGASCVAISSDHRRASFGWTASQHATSYQVWRRVWSLGMWGKVTDTTNLRFEENVDHNGAFYYYVVAKNASGETISNPTWFEVCPEGRGDNGGGGGNPPPTNNPNPNPPPTDPPPPPPATPKPIVDFTATPSNINVGHASLLRWSVQHATSSCSKGGGWSGSASTLGSQSVTPVSTTTYTLSCTGSGGTTTASVTVNVTAPPPGDFTIELVTSSTSGKVHSTQQTAAVCRLGGTIVPCDNSWWSSSDPGRIGVDKFSGLVRFLAVGEAEICVQIKRQSVTPRSCLIFKSAL